MGDKPKSKLVTIDCNSDRKLVLHRKKKWKLWNIIDDQWVACGLGSTCPHFTHVTSLQDRCSASDVAAKSLSCGQILQLNFHQYQVPIIKPSNCCLFCCTLHESTWCLTYLSDMLPKRPSNLRPKPRYDLLPTLVPGTDNCKNCFFQTSSILKHFKTCCKPRCSDGKNVFFPACEPSWSKECGHHLVCKQLCTSKGLHKRIQTCSANS